MSDLYILDEHHNPIPEPDPIRWAEWFEKGERVVRRESVGPYFISTVFLGMDHNMWHPDHHPLLYETMVFDANGSANGEMDIQERCATWDEAVAQHDRIVADMRRTVAG